MCPENSKPQPLINKLCQNHYWASVRLKSAQKADERDIKKEPDLQDLIDRADEIVSKYVRLSNSVDGYCTCFTCGAVERWQDMHCGHFIPRSNLFMRFDVVRNLRVQDYNCNVKKRGNIPMFARKLNEEKPGLADLLIEESSIVYKPTREEIKAIIYEFTAKVKKLKISA